MDWAPRRTIAVVLGGGAGARMGLDIPKQLIKIAGKTILEHTVSVFESCADIDDIVVLMTPGHVEGVREMFDVGGYRKVSAVLPGGDSRTETTSLALAHLGEEDANVLFHDAVRPLVSHRIIRECVNALRRHAAVDVAIGSADTIIEVHRVGGEDVIASIPDRSRLRRGQTPQGFRLPTIREAYRRAAADPGAKVTDDCGVVRHYLPDVTIKVIDGSEENIKVTHPIDVHLADKLFQLMATTANPGRTGRAYTEHLRGRTVAVFGGNSGIGEQIAVFAREHGADVFTFSRSSTNTHADDPAQVRRALHEVYAATGRIDTLVVSTGLLRRADFADTDDDTVRAMLASNLLAPVAVARIGLPYLRQTTGQLLLFTSSSYTRGRAGYALYSSAKAAVVNLTQALADEWSPYRVRVNCINPQRTASPMREKAFGAEPAETLLSCAQVARAALDVMTSAFTGQIVDVRLADPHHAGSGGGIPDGHAGAVRIPTGRRSSTDGGKHDHRQASST